MGVLAIIAALLLEQWRPLGERKFVAAALAAWAGWLEQPFNGGECRHGIVAWLVAVLPPALAAVGVHYLLYAAAPAACARSSTSRRSTSRSASASSATTSPACSSRSSAGDIDRARQLLEAWRGASGVVRSREEVIRLAIEEALVASHRHVFGVLFWFVVLPGPSGAILYRLAAYLAGRWKDAGRLRPLRAAGVPGLEWPAARLTAAAFAVVGDFEDAIYCWRTQARAWPDPNAGIVLAAGAGAMGVRLGMPVHRSRGHAAAAGARRRRTADGPFLDSTVGLLWRALVVWVFVLLRRLGSPRAALSGAEAPHFQHCVNCGPARFRRRPRSARRARPAACTPAGPGAPAGIAFAQHPDLHLALRRRQLAHGRGQQLVPHHGADALGFEQVLRVVDRGRLKQL